MIALKDLEERGFHVMWHEPRSFRITLKDGEAPKHIVDKFAEDIKNGRVCDCDGLPQKGIRTVLEPKPGRDIRGVWEMKPTAIEALDNLHRCAACYRSKDQAGWMRHLREMRDVAEAELNAVDNLRKNALEAVYEPDGIGHSTALKIYLAQPLDECDIKRIERLLDIEIASEGEKE